MNATLFCAICVSFLFIEASIVAKRQVPQLPGEILTTKPNKTDGYWTTERMLNATPIEDDVDYEDFENANTTRLRRGISIWTADRARSTRPLREKYYADITQYPFYNYGKLFVKTASGRGYCTAAFIRPNVLITAAHCLKNDNGWYKDFTFFQRYRGATNKGRQISVNKAFTYTTFVDSEGTKVYREDFAFLTTTESADGTPLSTRFTGQPAADELIYFASYSVEMEAEQKGGDNKYQPDLQLTTYVNYIRLVVASGYRNPEINALIHAPTNPLQLGSAGGAWLIQDESGVYHVVGVASHGKTTRGFTGAFSPVLNRRTMELLRVAENHVATPPCRRCNNVR